MKLKDNAELKDSSVVANAAMNRERNLQGINSYSKDLDFDILAFLKPGALPSLGPDPLRQPVRWLDLCCGTGKALLQATNILLEEGFDQFSITGIDLVPMYNLKPLTSNLALTWADLSDWKPAESEKFDLITCVHGLHYIGDKLDLIRRAVSWLKPDGVFRANLDIKNLRRGIESSKTIPSRVFRRKKGVGYDQETHILSCDGHQDITFPQFTYLGADDQAGPNYTLQPAVNSHYRHINGKRNKRSKAAKQRRREKREKRVTRCSEE